MEIDLEKIQYEKEAAKTFKRIGWLMILWLILGVLLSIILTIFLRNTSEGLVATIALSAAYIPLFFYRRKEIISSELWKSKEDFDLKVFLKWLAVILAFNIVFMWLWTPAITKLLSFLYPSFPEVAQMDPLKLPGLFDMILYIGLVGPLFEELIYRGIILRSLEKYGSSFAIVGSALLFGAVHMSLLQAPMAFGMGLFLGYLALRYSIGLSIILHMFNNTFVLFNRLIVEKNIEGLLFVTGLLVIVFIITAGYFLIKDRKVWWELVRRNSMDWKMFGKFLTSIPVALFLLICMIAMILV